jgi:hypothetical protein
MNDQPNLRQFLDEVNSFSDDEPSAAPAKRAAEALAPIGKVLEIAGSGSQICMDSKQLAELQSHSDPSVAMSGQVGSQVKMVVGANWLIANVRTMRADESGEILASVDFLGEGSRDSNGHMSNFRRGVTRYPIPGAQVSPVTTEDLRAVFAASDEPHIAIGTVYPTDDIRGAPGRRWRSRDRRPSRIRSAAAGRAQPSSPSRQSPAPRRSAAARCRTPRRAAQAVRPPLWPHRARWRGRMSETAAAACRS